MQLNEYQKLAHAPMHWGLQLGCSLLWGALITGWIMSGPNSATLDALQQILVTLHSHQFLVRYGLPLCIVVTLLLVVRPSMPATQRLGMQEGLGTWLMCESGRVVVVLTVGVLFSLIMLTVIGGLKISMNNLTLAGVLLLRYLLGSWVLLLILATLILCIPKMFAGIIVMLGVYVDQLLEQITGISLFLQHGLVWSKGVYDAQVILDIVLCSLYLFLIMSNLPKVLKRLGRS